MDKNHTVLSAMKAAFPFTLPILTGFLFLGLTYGIYMNSLGFSFWYPLLMSMTIFAGSMEFVAANMLLEAFSPLEAFIMTLMINGRHLFYGIAMLDRFNGLGWKKPLLIFGMCDESFSINYTAKIPEGIDEGWFMLWVTIFNYSYWVIGSLLGGLFGSFITFDTTGLEFVLTSMFVVIFLEQWLNDRDHTSAKTGIIFSVISLLIFGTEHFMIPAMIGILLTLLVLRRYLEVRI